MAGDKTIIELPPILNLPPVDTEQMQPYALDRYLGFLQELYDEVPLDQLSEEDLTDDERDKRKTCVDGIQDWLQKCSKDSGEAALMVYAYSSVIRYYMSDLKALVKRAYERKVEKERQETIKRRRLAALEEINPPPDDAKKYLTTTNISNSVIAFPGL